MKGNNQHNTFHRKAGTPLYAIWVAMKERCYNQKDRGYHKYGGRGIYVCDRWRTDFSAFLADMGERPQGMSLDRIDNDGPYSPENCRWATVAEQNLNRRNNHLETFRGETKTLKEWGADPRSPVSHKGLQSRLRYGWSFERAFTTPAAWRGQKALKQWAEEQR